jgi:hypothetical protein
MLGEGEAAEDVLVIEIPAAESVLLGTVTCRCPACGKIGMDTQTVG